MQELKNIIKKADDDYLIGLSNKGILKRAYKDLDEAEISAEYFDSSIEVSVADQKCTIISPIGESKCTCPSRSICRHIITAILWIKNNLSGGEEESSQSSESELPAGISDEFKAELSAYPFKLIQKAMKKKYLSSFIANAKRGKLPQLEETSIISGIIEDDDVTVKLLHPLEYSTCSCHSKELCKHKAAVILAWQLKNNIISLNELSEGQDEVSVDISEVHKAAQETKSFLCDILSNGLVRISDDIHEYAESIAVMCHSARLADLERSMREISNRLNGYVTRSPEFDAQTLFYCIMEALISALKILNTDDEDKLISYMGEFKESYISSDTLELIPLAVRNFSSVSGYAGEIYYFLNKNPNDENRFLTYSSVRPTFYESSKRKSTYSAPWGLAGNLKDAMNCELILKNPKLSDRKISSSTETKAEILGGVNLNQKLVLDNIYCDFRKMIEDTFIGNINSSNENLVLLSVNRCIDSVSDEISQSHNIIIEDYFGQRLTIKARYKNTSKEFFNSLSIIGKTMKNDSENHYTIFGNAYIEHGECYVYPIAIFDNIQAQEINNEEEVQDLEAVSDFGNYEFFAELFHELLRALCDIIQCGINSYDLYEYIYDFSQECERSGLATLGNEVAELYNGLKGKNHTYNTDNTGLILLLAEIYSYISVGIEKTDTKQAIYNLKKEN